MYLIILIIIFALICITSPYMAVAFGVFAVGAIVMGIAKKVSDNKKTAKVTRERNTVYKKDRVVQKGSPLDNLFLYFAIALFIVSIVLIVAEELAFGGFAFIIAVALIYRRISSNKVDNRETIITPESWPKDCQYDNYGKGLNPRRPKLKASKELNFYNKCLENKIENLDTERNFKKSLLIAQNMKLKDITEENVDDAFSKGKKENAYNIRANSEYEKNLKLSTKRNEELDVLSKSMKYYGMYGTEKRQAMLFDMIKETEKELSNKRYMQQNASRMMLEKESDWATFGGIASGIAGPAAGLATAIDIQNRNAQIRERNVQMAPYVALVSSKYASDAKGLESTLARFNKDYEDTKTKLISSDSTEKVFRNLKIENIGYTVSETGAVVVEADFTANPSYRIFDTEEPAIDGVVAARLYRHGVHEGSAYFVLPVDGITRKMRLAAICTKTTDTEAEYEIEFEPEDLWAIEKLG